MSQLLLAVYNSEETADHVLGVLRAKGDGLTASLESAATVRVRSDCAVTVTRTQNPRSNGSFWGVFWEALFGLIFRTAEPVPDENSNLGQLCGAIDRAGLDESFRARVRQTLRCGNSALALFALNWNTDSRINQLYLRPDAWVRAWLSPQQEIELLSELGRVPHDAGLAGL
jgi:uncharacterized membrane protein